MHGKMIPNVPVISYDGNNAAFFIDLLEVTLKAIGDEAGIEKFRSPQARKALADAGHEAMCKDLLAVEQFEQILSS